MFSETLMDERITLPIELEDADVLVSSGYNTKLLRRVTDKPIINIEPSLYDILSAYSEAITYENSHPVIIFPIKQYTNLTERIKNILAVPITVDAYDNVADLPRLIQKHWNEGCRCIIGRPCLRRSPPVRDAHRLSLSQRVPADIYSNGL